MAAVGELLGKVLVVDDDEVIRQLIAVNLTLEGFQVETAFDGQNCLDRVRDVQPDVVTLDVMMPRMDGWTTATRLRGDDSTSHIKVVLITARAQEDDKRRGSASGWTPTSPSRSTRPSSSRSSATSRSRPAAADGWQSTAGPGLTPGHPAIRPLGLAAPASGSPPPQAGHRVTAAAGRRGCVRRATG
nr:hypothetical protein GCM10020093_095680 [Planobispora longispora]